jgi:ketosteroid isomerase-like protein
MSQENVDLVRSVYAELAEGRFGTRAHLFSPEVEYARPSASAEAADLVGTWHGLEGMGRAIREWLDAFDDVRLAGEQYFDLGESVVVLTRLRSTAKATGMPFDSEGADVVTVRDGRIVRVRQYLHRAEALEAVGLRK